MAKAKEKLPPIPKHRPGARKPAQASADCASLTSGAQSPDPNLSHITPGLRHLAVPIGDLEFHSKNPRKHSEKNIQAIRASLHVHGQYRPAVASTRTGKLVVVVGNGMLAAALAEGWTHLAVEPKQLSEARENKLAITDNQTAALAEWDQEILASVMRDVDTANDPDLGRMLAELAEEEGVVQLHGEETAAPEEEESDADEDAIDLLFKAPFPWFGGKSRIARMVWRHFGDVANYTEPFFGSGAVLLNRPLPFTGTETVNDADGLVCNFWRAVQADPEAVAKFADWPVQENQLHAIHSWLVSEKESLQAKLEGDMDFFDAKAAGWWAWGMACWIGGGFCSGNGPWQVIEAEDGSRKLVHLSNAGVGVNRQRVHLGDAGQGVNRKLVEEAGEGKAGCGERGLLVWMQALSDRLRRVRVCCGDWTRICGGDSGDALKLFFVSGPTCGVFLDPPYADTANRDPTLYRKDSESVAHAVRQWAIRHGDDKRLRIALCGYEGEHQMPASWKCVAWKAAGGYENQSEKPAENCRRERVWFSPHCLQA